MITKYIYTLDQNILEEAPMEPSITNYKTRIN